MNRMSQAVRATTSRLSAAKPAKGQMAAKHAAGSHVLQHRRHARLVDPDQGHLPPPTMPTASVREDVKS